MHIHQHCGHALSLIVIICAGLASREQTNGRERWLAEFWTQMAQYQRLIEHCFLCSLSLYLTAGMPLPFYRRNLDGHTGSKFNIKVRHCHQLTMFKEFPTVFRMKCQWMIDLAGCDRHDETVKYWYGTMSKHTNA